MGLSKEKSPFIRIPTIACRVPLSHFEIGKISQDVACTQKIGAERLKQQQQSDMAVYILIQYGSEVNSFEYWWPRRAVSYTIPPTFDIMIFKHLEQDFVNDIFTSNNFLDTN